MKLSRFRNVWIGLPVLFVLGEVKPASARAESPLSADEVIQRVIARAAQASANTAAREYSYTKLTFTEELDNAGNVKERKERVYDVSLHRGLPSRNLIKINGHVPTDEERREQAENESRLRQLLGPGRPGRGDGRDNLLTTELAARFRFTAIGRTNVNGRPAYGIAFEPKTPPPPERRLVDRLLNRISGTLWVDCEEFEVARADVRLRSEVNLLGGVVASLKKLVYTLERSRVADGVWFDTSSSGDFEGRKLFGSTHIKTRSESRQFRRAGRNLASADSAG